MADMKPAAGPAPPRLVIFDCDGVLVDSEPLAIRVLADTIAAAGETIPLDDCYRLFLGQSLATTTALLHRDHGIDLSDADLTRMRQKLFTVFRKELRPIPGILEVLRFLELPICVASSSQLDRIRLALNVTGLLPAFKPHIFSASMVAHGKPAPDLFLYAAERMQIAPQLCLVIEDSPAGIEAAQRAGMAVIGFTGGGHAKTDSHRKALEALHPLTVVDDMTELLRFLQGALSGS
jgi:HAD superfamily hydrolase (TIGR01509 family)